MGIEQDVDGRRERFRSALAANPDDMSVFRKAVLYPAPFAIGEDDAFDLAHVVGDRWGVHPNRDIYLVGSAQLGFSISPSGHKRWRAFGDQSDIDLAIVSERLFEEFWNALDIYISRPTSWDRRSRCEKSLASGWIRPDLLPTEMADDWFGFFRELQRSRLYGGGVKIAAGIYHSMGFLERYQAGAIRECREATK